MYEIHIWGILYHLINNYVINQIYYGCYYLYFIVIQQRLQKLEILLNFC